MRWVLAAWPNDSTGPSGCPSRDRPIPIARLRRAILPRRSRGGPPPTRRDGGADGAAATAPSGADELTARFAGLALIEDDDDSGEEETEEEEAAARSRLIELLDAVPADDGGGGDRDGVGGGARHRGSARCDTASLRAFARDTLPQLVHLSHRRERHCRVMLQHRNADALAWRLHDLLLAGSKDSTDEGLVSDPSRCEDGSRELASLLVHNLSVAASSKEPRDEDRFKTRGGAVTTTTTTTTTTPPKALRRRRKGADAVARQPPHVGGDPPGALRRRGAARRYPRERRDGRHAKRPARATRARARADDPAGYDAWVDERKRGSNDGASVSDFESDADDADDDDAARDAPEDHDALCRGRLGTVVGALLAAMEPDSARPRLLAMDGGGFFRHPPRAAAKILPARHGDASLDAVGVMHRLLWIRPDATTTERETLMRALVDIDEAPVDSWRTETEMEMGSSTETRVGGAGDGRDGTPSCDPRGRWTWSRERGYENAPRRATGDGTGGATRLSRRASIPTRGDNRKGSGRGRRRLDDLLDQWDDQWDDLLDDLLRGAGGSRLRQRRPRRPSIAPTAADWCRGSGAGAGGGSLACTQAVHVRARCSRTWACWRRRGSTAGGRTAGRAERGVRRSPRLCGGSCARISSGIS